MRYSHGPNGLLWWSSAAQEGCTSQTVVSVQSAEGAARSQPLDVPVCELLQVGSRGGSWADRVGLFARAPSLHVRADIEVCVAGEDAASPQGSSTDGVARSWRARRCFRRFRTSTMEEGG